MAAELETELEALLAEHGFELVMLQRGGGRRRPLLRVRIDRVGGEPGRSSVGGEPGRSSVTADDCARMSRAIREHLEARPDAGADYVLEVSSPGVERPLVRARDFDRFAGRRAKVRGYGPLSGSAKQIEGRIVGTREDTDGSGERVIMEVAGDPVEIELSAIARATLVYVPEEDL